MRNISTGYWWLAVFPGIALVIIVILIDLFGSSFRYIMDREHHRSEICLISEISRYHSEDTITGHLEEHHLGLLSILILM